MKSTVKDYCNRSGFTLVELLITMAVFLTILAIAGQTFKTIVSQASKFSKSEESNIEGMIGLEVIRHDLEQMGFGLPWGFTRSDIKYAEATDSIGIKMNDLITPNTAGPDTGAVPRAFVGLKAFGNFSSDYFGVKGTSVGSTKASQRWTYIPYHNYSTSSGGESRPISFASHNLSNSDKVIIVRSNFNDPTDDHLLIVDKNNESIFYANFSYLASGGNDDPYFPQNDQQSHTVYGVDGTNDLRMPFNRADFFINDANVPSFCAPHTGVLSKATVNQANGNYTPIPLLDCVADMQVVIGWDTSDEGKANSVDAYSTVDGSTVTVSSDFDASKIASWLTNAKDLREHLKIVKVYILAQEGKKDNFYKSPATYEVGDLSQNGFTHMYSMDLTRQQYRWKLYRIVVRPKNLLSNQR